MALSFTPGYTYETGVEASAADMNSVITSMSMSGYDLDLAYNEGSTINVDTAAVRLVMSGTINGFEVYKASGAGSLIDLDGRGTGLFIDCNNNDSTLFSVDAEGNVVAVDIACVDLAPTGAVDLSGASSVDLGTLGANIIDSDQYVDGSIDNEHIADGAVDTEELAADCIDGTKIADNAIDSEHYVDGSIDTAHVADDAITEDKIADAAITSLTTPDYDSGWFDVELNTDYTKAHGLGAFPSRCIVLCQGSSASGTPLGSEPQVYPIQTITDNGGGCHWGADATNFTFHAITRIARCVSSTGGTLNIDSAMKLRVLAWA